MKHKASMGVFLDPKLKKMKNIFFDLEVFQLTVGRETSLEKVWHFARSKKCLST